MGCGLWVVVSSEALPYSSSSDMWYAAAADAASGMSNDWPRGVAQSESAAGTVRSNSRAAQGCRAGGLEGFQLPSHAGHQD